MSNGLGAGFGGLLLLAILLGLAGLLTLSLGAVYLFQRRRDAVPRLLKYLSIAFLAGVVVVAGFAIAALFDEVSLLPALFTAIAVIPLLVVGVYLSRTTELSSVDLLASTGLAWSVPFLLGVVVVFGLTLGVSQVLGWTSVQSQQRGLAQIATFVGGLVVVVGTVLLSKTISLAITS